MEEAIRLCKLNKSLLESSPLVGSVRPNFGIGIRYRPKVSVSEPKFFLPKPKPFFFDFFQNILKILKKISCISAS